MKDMTTKAAMEYVKTLHQRSNDARYMSICEKVNEAKHALIREREELESKCNAYDTYVSLCCERGGSYDAFYSFSDSLYDSMRNEMLKHVDNDEEYEAVYDSVRELSDCDVVAMCIELFEVDEAEVFKKLDSACDELRDAVVNEVEYMTDYDENETLRELRDALAEDEADVYSEMHGDFYFFDCMNAFITDRYFEVSAFKNDADAISTAENYEATLYRLTYERGERVKTVVLYEPGEDE